LVLNLISIRRDFPKSSLILRLTSGRISRVSEHKLIAPIGHLYAKICYSHQKACKEKQCCY